MSDRLDLIPLGTRLELEVGAVAHGGHCVARHLGQVVFVRHSLPGERVVAEVTGVGSGGKFLLADAVEVLSASPDRRPAPCPHSGPGRCGGCDWQHVTPEAQRRLKQSIVVEAMKRQGGVDVEVEVEAVDGDVDGLGWRTRVTYSLDEAGRPGFFRHHSHTVVPVDRCLLATDAVDATDVTRRTWPGAKTVSVVATSTGEVAVTPSPLPPGGKANVRLHERVGDTEYVVSSDSFWQVHPGAPVTLTQAVIDAVAPRVGEHVIDLYAGSGLFAVAIAELLGPGGRVDAVEFDAKACSSTRRTVHDMPTVRVHEQSVDRWLASDGPRRCDLVVLDPPESGAGKDVMRRVAKLNPRLIAYVSCGPASLGRDVAALAALGWTMTSLRAFDLFPTTQHVECLAVFARTPETSVVG